METTDLEIYQTWVETRRSPLVGEELQLPQSMAGLVAEVGEIAGVFQKAIARGESIFSDEVRNKVIDEMGDALWYLAALANYWETTLDEVIERNMVKINNRNMVIHGKDVKA